MNKNYYTYCGLLVTTLVHLIYALVLQLVKDCMPQHPWYTYDVFGIHLPLQFLIILVTEDAN